MAHGGTAVLVHLSGDLRGTTQRLAGTDLRIGSASEADIRLIASAASPLGELHASLRETEDGHRLRPLAPHRVWVNGHSVGDHLLASGDLIELGEDGPMLRYRRYAAGRQPFKSMREALADCYQSARNGSRSALGRTRLFAGGIVRELSTEVSPLTRTATLLTLAALVLLVVVLGLQSRRLERQREDETRQVEGLQDLLDSAQGRQASADELERLRRDLEARIASTAERLDFLEEMAGAAQRTVAEANRSVVFLQGSYGFRDLRSQKPLRFAVGPDGRPLTDASGMPAFSTDGAGPIAEAFFTGTGFIASVDGLVVTNRHVALPWEFDDEAKRVSDQGFEPFMLRLIGYVSGVAEPFDLELVVASGEADLAVLRCSQVTGVLRSLPLDEAPPQVGEPVIVLGFPTGIQAMMARADRTLVDRLAKEKLDFWDVARRLSDAGQIGPLATRGIVGQVTESKIVYDAETTSGGSGGPVLNLDGRVVAVNSAILIQFGGSNLGVPAPLVGALLERAAEVSAAPPTDTP